MLANSSGKVPIASLVEQAMLSANVANGNATELWLKLDASHSRYWNKHYLFFGIDRAINMNFGTTGRGCLSTPGNARFHFLDLRTRNDFHGTLDPACIILQ